MFVVGTEFPDLLEHLVFREPTGNPALPERMAPLAFRALPEPTALTALMAGQAQMALPEPRALKALPAPRELKARRVDRETANICSDFTILTGVDRVLLAAGVRAGRE